MKKMQEQQNEEQPVMQNWAIRLVLIKEQTNYSDGNNENKETKAVLLSMTETPIMRYKTNKT